MQANLQKNFWLEVFTKQRQTLVIESIFGFVLSWSKKIIIGFIYVNLSYTKTPYIY